MHLSFAVTFWNQDHQPWDIAHPKCAHKAQHSWHDQAIAGFFQFSLKLKALESGELNQQIPRLIDVRQSVNIVFMLTALRSVHYNLYENYV